MISLLIGVLGSLIAAWLFEHRIMAKLLGASARDKFLAWLAEGCPILEQRHKLITGLAKLFKFIGNSMLAVAAWLLEKGGGLLLSGRFFGLHDNLHFAT
jgi:hypothetical protein